MFLDNYFGIVQQMIKIMALMKNVVNVLLKLFDLQFVQNWITLSMFYYLEFDNVTWLRDVFFKAHFTSVYYQVVKIKV